MRDLALSFLLFACLLAAPVTRADTLVGIAFVEGLTGLNLEYMGERTSYYGVFGAHSGSGGLEAGDNRWVVGFRKRVDRAPMASPGFFVGMVAGDLGGRKQYERLGVGGELGHQWLTPNSRTTLSAGFAALEEVEEQAVEAEPGVFLGVTWSVRR